MSSARRLHYSYAEYVRVAELSNVKLEYYDGEIFAMAGGTLEHAMLAMELGTMIRQQLPTSCRIMTSDARILLPTGLATYPDLSVVCGELMRAPEDRLSLTNPVLLVEVLSPSTQDYDRGEKLRHYQELPSLEGVLLVAQDQHCVTAVVRTRDGWTLTEHRDGDIIELARPSLALPVRDIYRPLAPIA